METKVIEFKQTLLLSDKTFEKMIDTEVTVHLIRRVRGRVSLVPDSKYLVNEKVYFQLTIPKHIFEQVRGSSKEYLDEYLEKSGVHPCLDKKIKFRQKIRSDSFHKLMLALEHIDTEARLIHDIQVAEGDKVIFVKYHSDVNDENDRWMFATMGKKITFHFQFFVCYKKHVKDSISGKEKIRYEAIGPDKYGVKYRFKYYSDDIKDAGFQIIPWTEEREIFLFNIQEGFIKLNDKLAEYLANLDAKKLDKLISNKIKLLEEHK